MPNHVRRPAFALAVSGLAATALLLSACGGDDDSNAISPTSSSAGGTSSSASASSATSVLGTPNKATGTPIVIGLTNAGKTTAIDTTPQQVTGQAVADYANDYLGGINGHKIVIKRCDHQNTPTIESDCANQFIQAGAAAVSEAGTVQIPGPRPVWWPPGQPWPPPTIQPPIHAP